MGKFASWFGTLHLNTMLNGNASVILDGPPAGNRFNN
jgi:hypothetical protein